MTEKKKEYFGEGCDLEAFKKDIEAIREQKTEDVPFDGLTIEEKEKIKAIGMKAMEDFNNSLEKAGITIEQFFLFIKTLNHKS